jgi:hypothetical protein
MPYGPDEHGFITEAQHIEEAGVSVALHPEEPEALQARVDGAARVHDRLLTAYEAVRAATHGTHVDCPQCGRGFQKTHPAKTFCSNARSKGKRNCKDRFWNRVRGLRGAMGDR